MCDCNFPSIVATLFSWRFLAASSSSSLHAAMNLRPPSVTASTQTSAFNAIVFQSPVMPNARMLLCTQLVHSFSFPPRPLRTSPSRFPNMIRFGNHPPLIRRSVPTHKRLLVRNVVSMLLQPAISRARLYWVIRWSGLLRCASMMRSKTRWCTDKFNDWGRGGGCNIFVPVLRREGTIIVPTGDRINQPPGQMR